MHLLQGEIIMLKFLRGGLVANISDFHPEPWGKGKNQFLNTIFQMGWEKNTDSIFFGGNLT